MTKDVINQVKYQMDTDDSATIKDNARIIKAYNKADEATKSVVDSIFTDLCGFSLNTIIEQSDYFEDEE